MVRNFTAVCRAEIIIFAVFKVVVIYGIAVLIKEVIVLEFRIFISLYKVVQVCVNLTVFAVVKPVVPECVNNVLAVGFTVPIAVELFVKNVTFFVIIECVVGRVVT